MSAVVLQGNARSLPLRDESVDLIVTSPPYWALRSYTDGGEHYDGQIGSEPSPKEYVADLVDCTREWVRVLKPTGSMFVNLGDKMAGSGGHNNSAISAKSTLRGNGHVGGGPKIKATRRSAPDRYSQSTDGIARKSLMGLPWRYALACIDDLGLTLRAEIIWDKPNGLPESVTDRVRRSHEQWFHFVNQGSYYTAIDEIREPYANGTAERYASGYNPNKRTVSGAFHNALQRSIAAGDSGPSATNPLGKLPGSVWTIPSEPLSIPEWAKAKYNLPDHFAAFPQEWPRRIILGWSQPGSVVLDPFGGTGTVAGVARMLGRTGISLDGSMDYTKLARWRIWESGHFAKTTARTDRDRQGSMDLDGAA